eukprot:NODE_2304_length_1153_cov_5.294384_g1911_i0.p5 GENE.NODE_2304_length_1153_cov_5.294384_g1911_i0~~NODE_2304_length_1153_cov_5.294384_g1911_i0.p5  ORF type:complete len:67 (+),score=9.43 NODE_2304_length_1153_cov_5.294384_g1911_i0:759-959(+)
MALRSHLEASSRRLEASCWSPELAQLMGLPQGPPGPGAGPAKLGRSPGAPHLAALCPLGTGPQLAP